MSQNYRTSSGLIWSCIAATEARVASALAFGTCPARVSDQRSGPVGMSDINSSEILAALGEPIDQLLRMLD